jgi:hypothetical protein
VGGKVRIDTVADARGDRPWTRKPRGRRLRKAYGQTPK